MIDQLSAEPRHRPLFHRCPGSSGQARDIARAYLSALRPPATPETVDNVVLVVSELVTNAYRHAGGLSDFRVSGTAGNLRVEVTDLSPVLPCSRSTGEDVGLERGGGYGWPLIHRIAHEVTVRREPQRGKTIDVFIR